MKQKITKKVVDGTMPDGRVRFLWDTELRGFGVKITPTGSKVYVIQYRTGGRGSPTRRYTVGKHGTISTEKARKTAQALLGEVANGRDPQQCKMAERASLTVAALCDLYLAEGCATKKASTIATDKGRIARHIKPLLGRRKVKDLTPNDVRRFMQQVAQGKTAVDEKTGKRGRARVTGGKGAATRTVGLLGGILSFAVSEGIRPDNPARGVKRYPDTRKERFLSPEELARLGEALSTSAENPYAVAAIRFLLLTGCRKGEVLSLTWPEVDSAFGCLRLSDSKTGQKVVPLGRAALDVLDTLPRLEGNDHVFPGEKEGRPLVGLPKIWNRIKTRAGLDGVRLHDLRHSFASVGAGYGLSLPVVGKLLGHSDPKTTARYAHIADDPARTAANHISAAIEAGLSGSGQNHRLLMKG